MTCLHPSFQFCPCLSLYECRLCFMAFEDVPKEYEKIFQEHIEEILA